MMDAGISRGLLIDKLHMLLNGAINEQDEGLLTDLISAGMDIDAIAENMADGVIRLRKQEIKLIDERMKEETIKRISGRLERFSLALPDRIFAWRYSESDIANDRVKCTTSPDKNAPSYLRSTPLLEHAGEMRNMLRTTLSYLTTGDIGNDIKNFLASIEKAEENEATKERQVI